MEMDSRFISHRRSLGSCRRSAAILIDFVQETESIWPTNNRGFRGHRLDFICGQNAHIFRTLLPLCVSSSLAGMEGGSDQIAGSKLVNAGRIPDQTFSARELEKGDTVQSLAIFLQQTSCLQNLWEVCSVESSLN